MKELLAAMAHHGYMWTFAVLLMESLGLPLPAAIALVAGGAAVASHTLSPQGLLFTAVGALLLGDIAQFWMGRTAGWALLGFLCRLSLNPETCILRSAESFYKRGKATLLIAKFIPGLNTMAAPLAGSMKMRPLQFLRFDLSGATLYTLAYGGMGFLFHDFLAAITRGLQTAGHVFGEVLFTAALVYTAYRVWIYRKNL